MAVISSVFRWIMIKRMYEIELFRKYPADVQKDVLFKLVDTAKDTEWGMKHDYQALKFGGINEFRERVPIQTYEDIKPYVERLLAGEKKLLWPTEVKWFAKSSGTTSDKSKFIPVSKEALEDCHFRGGKDVMAVHHYLHPNTNVFSGKALILGGSHQISNVNSEAFFGDLSAILIQNMPFWAHFRRTPDLSITLMDEWEEKIERMAKATMVDDVTNLSGVPSWTLVLIKRILEIADTDNILDVWPNLELFIHGGVSFVPYRDQFKQLIKSPNMRYMETYNASEGFFALQDNPARDDMLLMLDYGIFYEFVPFEDVGLPNPRVFTVDDVEIDKNYALVISTNAGLWRYMIGDTVKVTSKIPFKIKISGRTKHFINAAGEEVIIDNAEKALKLACERTGALVKEYTAGPIYPNSERKGSHQWLIEFDKEPNDMAHFIELLDRGLQSVNSDYEAKRYKDLNLEAPTVIAVRSGLFYDWLKNKGKLGGQHKIPRLANNRNYLDYLLKML